MWEPGCREGGNSHLAKLSEREVVVILHILFKGYMTIDQVAEVFGVSYAAVQAIKDNRTWRYISRFPGFPGFQVKRRSPRKGASA